MTHTEHVFKVWKKVIIAVTVCLSDEEEMDDKPKISAEKKKELKEEFLTIMQQKFLQGEDKKYDYRWVLMYNNCWCSLYSSTSRPEYKSKQMLLSGLKNIIRDMNLSK